MGSKIVITCFALLALCYIVNADTNRDLLGMLLKRIAPCKISMQCPGKTDICYEHVCRSNVPCNKDNDCFFYAAADVANQAPHPKCYRTVSEHSLPAGYGYCMLMERVGNDAGLIRIKGDDVDSLDEHPIPISA